MPRLKNQDAEKVLLHILMQQHSHFAQSRTLHRLHRITLDQ